MYLASKVSPQELTELLHKRAFLEDNVQDLDEVDSDILDDVLPVKDRQEAVKRQKEAREHRVRFTHRTESIADLVDKLTPSLGKTRPRMRDYRAVGKAVLAFQKKGTGVWRSFIDPDDAPIKDLKPHEGRFYKDLTLQRFKIHHLRVPGEVKSFAWTRRGVPAAYAEALKQLWSWEQQLYGVECPLPPELLSLAS